MKSKLIVVFIVVLCSAGAFYIGLSTSNKKDAIITNSKPDINVGVVGLSGEIKSISKNQISVSFSKDGKNSKVFQIGTSTEVLKTTSVNISDIKQGDNVSVSGFTNPDGTITAIVVKIMTSSK